ncbi:MAG TPA: leucine-rich repeat protein [Candidatus Tectomicrobia bacterium]
MHAAKKSLIKDELIPLLASKLDSGKADKYYIILGDTGMGKTTFMINFFLTCARRWRARYQIALLPLGDPRADEAIDAIDDKAETVLLLDAFDEDVLALIDYAERLKQLIAKTRDFHCMIMTSRTQFFPSEDQEPAGTGIGRFGGDKGEYEFKKFYLSPFDNSEIRRFIARKYAFYQSDKRRRAHAIIDACPDLVVRPMLLAYIEDLMAEPGSYKYPHQIYEAMVRSWIARERVANKEELRRFSEAVAIHMYLHQKERKGLFLEGAEVAEFADQHGIRLQEFEFKSRSLLNRDAQGRLKFAHKSILEYFLSLELDRNPRFWRGFEMESMQLVGEFTVRRAWEREWRQILGGSTNIEHTEGREAAYFIREGFSGPLADLDFDHVTDVISLVLDKSSISNIAPLQNFRNLQNLTLKSPKISNLGPLAQLTRLRNLDLRSNRISDLDPLAQLTDLRTLDLRSNWISDLGPLAQLTKLQTLYLSSNQISNLEPLAQLTSLQTLYLAFNQISDLGPLAQLTKLQTLYLSSNQISNLEPLTQLTSLRFLYLGSNRLMGESIALIQKSIPTCQIIT